MRVFFITVLCLLLAAPVFGRMYKWTDKDGKIHFTDNPSQIPLDYRNRKHIKKMKTFKGGHNNLPSAQPAPAPKHLGANKGNPHSKDTGIDKQKVKDLQRLIQKKHYGHK